MHGPRLDASSEGASERLLAALQDHRVGVQTWAANASCRHVTPGECWPVDTEVRLLEVGIGESLQNLAWTFAFTMEAR